MSKQTKWFSFVYLIIFLSQLYAEYSDNHILRAFSKPMIVLILMGWIYADTRLSASFHRRIFIGLVFAWAGDILLMLQQQNSIFFILGLIAFLFCHVFYISAFALDAASKPAQKNPFLIWAVIFFSTFCAALFIYLRPHLGPLQVPVLIYAIIISAMAIMSVNRFGHASLFSVEIIFYGAVLFLFSDTMLAYNKFVQPLPNAGLIIMASYMLAQYFIVLGSIKSEKLL